ncbi:MAG: hypothetical protein JW940_19935 [Polyangiaceae bacterium]|nr:hypothetical protein [Polyangiaceae bacterium]
MILLRRLTVLTGFALSVVACGGSSSGAKCPKGAEGAVEKGAKTGVAGV